MLVLLGVAACADGADQSSGDRATNEAEDNAAEPADRSATGARGGVSGEGEAQAAGGEGTTSEPVLDPEWYEDSDGNYVPNFIEVANGYDPDRNDATVFRIPEEQRNYEYGSPAYEALQNLSDRITQGFEQRQQARDEAARRLEELQQQYYELRERMSQLYNSSV